MKCWINFEKIVERLISASKIILYCHLIFYTVAFVWNLNCRVKIAFSHFYFYTWTLNCKNRKLMYRKEKLCRLQIGSAKPFSYFCSTFCLAKSSSTLQPFFIVLCKKEDILLTWHSLEIYKFCQTYFLVILQQLLFHNITNWD